MNFASEELQAMTFAKADAGKPRIGLIPHEAIRQTAEVLTIGAAKYGADNWVNCPDWSRYFDAMERHIWAWKSGEDADPETGKSHLAHAMCCLSFLIAYQARNIGNDDR